MNDRECFEMIKNPKTASQNVDKPEDKKLFEAYRDMYEKIRNKEKFSIEDYCALFSILIDDKCSFLSK